MLICIDHNRDVRLVNSATAWVFINRGARSRQIGSGFDQVWTMLNISGTIADIIECYDLINIKVLSILLQLVSCNVCLVVKGFLYKAKGCNSSYKAKGDNGCANPG